MTTNQDEYLKDETGNRRWLPVAIKQNVNIEWLQENREQLYAEAYHRVITLKETTYEFPEEEMLRQQAMRQPVDPREDQIYQWYWKTLGDTERAEGITTRDAYVIGVQHGSAFGKEMGRLEEMIIGSILRDGLKLERKRSMDNGSRSYRYYETDESKALAPREKTEVSNMLIPLE
jgi:putative DNA primase/helicase